MSNIFAYDVFLSYSAKDMAVVRPLAERLRKDGLRVWFDEWIIKPGDSIPAKIEDGLEHSRLLVLCMSANAFGSDWAQLETGTFRFRDPLNKERRFIPLRLDDTPIKGSLAQFRYINWISDTLEVEFSNLLAACRGEIEKTPTRQRICMISSEYPPHILGGLGVHVTRLSAELSAFNDIDLVLPYQKSSDYAPAPHGVRTHPLARTEANYDDPISWLHFAQHAFDLVKHISTTGPKPEVVHCHDWVTVLCGIKCRWLLKIPMVFHVHLPNRTPFCSSVENLGLVCSDLLTVNSQAMAEQMKARFPDKKVAVVPNGVDTKVFKPGDPNADMDRYVLFVGRLVEQKGVDFLLRAFVHVLKRFPNIELKIVGTGPCESAYKRLADCLLIGDRVRFVGWKVGLELSQLYQSASVVAVPSIYEPFGMTALEAMACARPVVASNTGGLKEIIRHEETGCLVAAGDHLDLAQWIIKLLDRKSLRQELGYRAGRMVHESTDYQWSSVARQFAEIYYKLSCEALDLTVLKEAREYAEQIRQLACSLDRSLSVYYQDDWLFNWGVL
ncbi:MAG: glycosyltransferase [Desulfosalsimonadaceae bacterium]